MSRLTRPARAALRGTSVIVLSLAALTACTSTRSPSGSAPAGDTSRPLVIGTTDQVTSLDPAGSWDAGSGTIESEVYAPLLNTRNGSSDVVPDLASGIRLTGPQQYTVTLKPG